MATYAELFDLRINSDLKNKVAVACVVASEDIRTEAGTVPNHAARLTWAKGVFADPSREAERMLWAVLAQNKDAPTNAILTATDTAIQTAVDAAVDVFAV